MRFVRNLAVATVLFSLPNLSGAQGVDCERFSKLSAEAQAAYTWGLVDGATALRASFQIDAIALRKDGAREPAAQSELVAEAVSEKVRPALRRAPADLTKTLVARCPEVAGESAILPYLEALDRWRREAPQGDGAPLR